MESEDIDTAAPSDVAASASPEAPSATAWRALNPRITLVWRCAWLLAGLAVGLPVTVLVVLFSGRLGGSWIVTGLTPIAIAVVVGGAGGALWVPRRYAAWRYRFGPDALEIERGVFWRTVVAVPYQRIQQVAVEHGPLQRRLGLVGLTLTTASALSLAALPGIAGSDAAELRAWLLHRAGRDDGA